MDKISIIVPVYNVEKYLVKCLESIVAQTYKNLEIMLIDDGSTDSCPALCDKFAALDSRIIVVHQANAGVAKAICVGIEMATSNYIGFVDGDDFVGVNMFSKMLANMHETSADVVMCNFARFGLTERVEFSCKNAIFVVGGNIDNNARLLMQDEMRFAPCRWNKLFKREFLTAVLPKLDTDINVGEDANLTMLVFLRAKIVSYIDDVLYYYLVRESSIVNVNLKKSHWKDDEKLIRILANEMESFGDIEILAIFKNYVIGIIKNNIRCILKNNLGRDKALEILSNEYYQKYIDDVIRAEKRFAHKIYDILLKHKCFGLIKVFLGFR